MKTRIFLDSGDVEETKKNKDLLGILHGQTTNPSLIAKNPQAVGKKFTENEIKSFYKEVVIEISNLIPQGSVSIEVYADLDTPVDKLLNQAREMSGWIPNAHIKLPITKTGLEAAKQCIKEGIRVNMTLCFSQEQAAAVYAATRGAKKGDVFVSPFVGRLDDRGECGMDLIKNIIEMYKYGDGHVEVLSASVRNLDHLLYSIALGCDIVTAPLKVLKEWKEKNMQIPGAEFVYNQTGLAPIAFKEIDLNKSWQEYDISHEMTEKGIEKFVSDWNNLIAPRV